MSSQHLSALTVPFTLHGAAGAVRVRVSVNDDPAALGCGLLFDDVPAEAARGFPTCTATVDYPRLGYFAIMGWIQLVRSTDSAAPGEYQLDAPPLLDGSDTPFAWFGTTPTLFDAPFRDDREPMTWRAEAFLCATPDAVMSRRVRPLCAFSWGFRIEEHQGVPVVDAPRPLPDGWDAHVPLLRRTFPTWRFREA